MNIESLIPIEEIKNAQDLFDLVNRLGEIIILQDNKPAYRVNVVGGVYEQEEKAQKKARIDLWVAMDIVLAEQPDNVMHAQDIAKEIAKHSLYTMKDGSPVTAVQIRARAGHKPEHFECLKGNYIRLIRRYKK